MTELRLLEPTTVEDAVAALRADGARPLAGGTALVQVLKQGLHDFSTLVSLRRVAGLDRIAVEGDDVVLGAMARLWDVAASPEVRALAAPLADAVRTVGNVRVRSMATVGGNVCYGDPHCDPPAALLALGARVVLAGVGGRRTVPMDEFFRGYYETAVRPDELLVELRVPSAGAARRGVYVRYTFASEEDWPCVAVAAAADVQRDGFTHLRVAIAGVADRPLLVRDIAAEVPFAAEDDIAELAARQAEPVSDLRGSEAYKRDMVRVHTRRALHRLAGVPRQ